MRLQTIAQKYRTQISQFYENHPGLETKSYKEQFSTFISSSFGAPESRTNAFDELGYATNHIFANIEPMQKRWALENEITYDEDDWLLKIVAAQVNSFQPEILLFNLYTSSTPEFLSHLKSECTSIKLVLGWQGETSFNDTSVIKEHDVMLSCSPETVKYIHDLGGDCYHINHGFDPRVLEKVILKRTPSLGFIFIGSITKGSDFHNHRERIILDLIDNTELQIWANIKEPSLRERIGLAIRIGVYDSYRTLEEVNVQKKTLAKIPLLRKASGWKSRPKLGKYVDDRIAQRSHPPIFGLAMFQKLHDSKVVFNVHGDNARNSASNMRLFEATGVGTCLLTDWKDNLPGLFKPEVEAVTYRSTEECIEKVKYLLEHEEERKAIAEAGQQRTLCDHTIRQRVEQIDEIIQTHLRSVGGK